MKFFVAMYLMFGTYFTCRAMCSIDFALPMEQDEGDRLNAQDSFAWSLQNYVKKRPKHRKNFEVLHLKDPVLFSAHLSKNSLLIVDKPWLEVVKSLETQPVHRHIFGA